MNFIYLLIGLVFIIKGADLLVESASKLAKTMGVPVFIIGLSVVAFGTSAPEMAIGILSGIQKTNVITLGNVIGSSIVNVSLVIGLTAFLFPIKVQKSEARRELPILLGVQIIFLVIATIGWDISRIDGVLLLLVFCLVMFYLAIYSKPIVDVGLNILEEDNILLSQEGAKDVHGEKGKTPLKPLDRPFIYRQIAWLLVGLTGLVIGGDMVVDNSVAIAQRFGLSETLIGLTIVSIGTTFPELITSVVAAAKKESEIAVGNVIGSSMFNILFVLGLSSVISPIPVAYPLINDLIVMLAASLLLFLFAYFKDGIPRFAGAIFFFYYTFYLLSKIFF